MVMQAHPQGLARVPTGMLTCLMFVILHSVDVRQSSTH